MKSKVWSVGLFAENNDIFEQPFTNMMKVFNAKKIRNSKRHIHTYADPFLFVYNDELYIFLEIQEVHGYGYIHVWKTADLINWQDKGIVLKESFHLSYPFVFRDQKSGKIYLLPESSQAGKTYLYEFEEFPTKLIKKNLLLTGKYVDSSIYQKDGIYYLITTDFSTGRLHLFCSNDLNNSDWKTHPLSPLSDNPLISRNGGGFVAIEDKLYRIAQNGQTKYGEGIVILEVCKLTPETYEEHIIIKDFTPTNQKWQRDGRHHFSIAKFRGKNIIAIDGLQDDFLFNKALNLIYKFI